ncbi:MAG: DNA repair protein RecN [Bacillota bacterium]|nr:DNA repair protein RecN [Bacillota bacterium]
MLLALQVRNFALIDQLELAFGPGLNVITGETGAGKSMLIDAMELVIGGRAHTDQVRTGTEQASVDAVFDLSGLPDAVAALAGNGIEAPGGQVVLSREVNLSGRNLCRICGRLATSSVVRDMAAQVVDIHGQHEHQSLTQPARHREVLDAYSGDAVLSLADAVAVRYRRLRELERELTALAGDVRDRAQREDLLRFQLKEIEAARLMAGEDEELRRERHILVNAERLAACADTAYALLYEAGGPSGRGNAGASGKRSGAGGGAGGALAGAGAGASARDLLGRALGELETAAALDRRLEPAVESSRSLVYALDDLGVEVRRYREGIEADPQRLEAIQSRLELIALLRRKYADTVDGVIAHAQALREQLARLEAGEQTALRLEAQVGSVREQLAGLCYSLTEARRAAAGRLAAEVSQELEALGMPAVLFQVRIEHRPDPAGLEISGETVAFGEHGADEVEMLLSPNPGEPPRRLARAASGGELSRIMLALKTVLARADRIPVLIFDEIDQGIGGLTAGAVGQRLAKLGGSHQVLCVTHLPQIAAYADHHFVVTKESDSGKTRTRISAVGGPARLMELARMLGAGSDSQVAIEHARELLGRCESERRSIRAS